MTTYRAAYWVSDDDQGQLVLTTKDDAHRSDDDLLALARAEYHAHVGSLDEDGDPLTGRFEVGPWTE